MKTYRTDRGALEHRLLVTGIPKHLVPQVVDIWCRWCTHNGPEWAVRRFKSLKVDLIRQQAGLAPLTQYVRKNSKGGWYGALGALFKWSARSEKKFSCALQALCIYTSVTSENVTKSQMTKFHDAVSCEAPTGMTFEELTELFWVISSEIGPRTIEPMDNRMVVYRGSPTKIAPLPHNLGYSRQDQKVLADLTWFRNPRNVVFAMKHRACYEPVLDGIGMMTNWTSSIETDTTSYAGEVHFIQEPGYKLRSIASPYRIHQLATKPLQEALGRLVKQLPWDCTFDQDKAIAPIQAHLQADGMVHSVDLSSATDYFPLDIQVYVLKAVFGSSNPHVLLFRDLSTLTWKSEIGDITWKRGQPLGLNPSFFAFTLTHGVILHWLAGCQPGKFYIVGDDVVILDTVLYEKYIGFLKRISCPYSVDKSITSRKVAEFAGKVITPTGRYPQLKWRKMSDDSFLDLARLLGRRCEELMTNRQKRVFNAVKHYLPPFGLNMSKPGSDYAAAFLATEQVLSSIQHNAVRSLVDLIRPSWNNAMDDPGGHVLNVATDAFDEKVYKVFRQTVFSHWLWLDQVSELPRALGLEPRLPTAAHPSRVSTLLRYERILDQVSE